MQKELNGRLFKKVVARTAGAAARGVRELVNILNTLRGGGLPISDKRGLVGQMQGRSHRGGIQEVVRVVLHKMEIVGVLGILLHPIQPCRQLLPVVTFQQSVPSEVRHILVVVVRISCRTRSELIVLDPPLICEDLLIFICVTFPEIFPPRGLTFPGVPPRIPAKPTTADK
jgi:hypothetical protein